VSRAWIALPWLLAGAAACYPDTAELRARGRAADTDADSPGDPRADGAAAMAGGAGGMAGGGAGGTPGAGGTGAVAGSGGAVTGSGGTSGSGGNGGNGGVGGSPASDGPPPSGGTADATDAGGITETVAEACAAYADATVGALVRCSPIFLQMLYGSPAVAQQRMRLLCRYAELPGSNFPRRPVGPCLAAMRTFPCADYFDGLLPAACLAPGDYPAGSRCIDGGQCQSGFCDLSAPAGGCGQCARAPQAGEPCAAGQLCGVGLRCTNSRICRARGDLGSTCAGGEPCRETLACLGGSCARKGAPGAACAAQVDCDMPNGVACNPNTRQCISFRLGPSCGVAPDGSAVFCQAAGTCREGQGPCDPAAADGESCDPNFGPNCMLPATCLEGRCQLPPYDARCVRP
jgi:hypothetical protein